MKLSSEWSLFFASFMTGTLAGTPFIWCFLYRTMFSFTVVGNWYSTVYIWSVVAVQCLMGTMCLLRYSSKLNKSLDILCMLCFALVSASLIFGYTSKVLNIGIPIFFIVTAAILSLWVPVTYEVVYLMPVVTHGYYECGILLSSSVYYLFVYYRLFTTPLFMLPFAMFLGFGFYALRLLQNHDAYYVALNKHRAIFSQKSNRYIRLPLYQIVYHIAMELFLVGILTLSIIVLSVTLTLYTDVMYGLSVYLFLFSFGNLCCGGLSYESQFLSLMYSVAMGILATVLYVFGKGITPEILSCLVALLFILYFNAMGCQFYIMRQKLNRGVNAPKMILLVCLICNIALSVTLLALNKALY